MAKEPKLDFGPTRKTTVGSIMFGTGKLMCSMRY